MTDPSISDIISEATENARAYVNVQLDHIKLTTAEKLAKISSWIITNFLLAIMLALVLGFATVAVVLLLGRAMDNYPLAFFFGAVIHLALAGWVLWMRKKMIAEPLLRVFLKELFEDKKDDDDELEQPKA
ncbi:MAG: phage holin family protein [Chitinophagales bacterium]|nr:phage holin family protein [Chitinophagales bacterium]